MLTVKQIAAEVGMSYDALTRLLREDERQGHRLQEWLGGVIDNGAVRYPEEALGKFARIAEANRQGIKGRSLLSRMLDPEAVAEVQTQPALERNGTANALAVVQTQEPGALVQLTEAWARHAEALDRHTEQLGKLPPPDDALLTGDQAAQLLQCSTATLRKRVRPVLRGRWRRSDLLRWIEGLGRKDDRQ